MTATTVNNDCNASPARRFPDAKRPMILASSRGAVEGTAGKEKPQLREELGLFRLLARHGGDGCA
jgi:hypothetical protein